MSKKRNQQFPVYLGQETIDAVVKMAKERGWSNSKMGAYLIQQGMEARGDDSVMQAQPEYVAKLAERLDALENAISEIKNGDDEPQANCANAG